MKFLELSTCVEINSLLSALDSGECVIVGRLEAYSCKTAGSDKKLYKTLSSSLSGPPAGDDTEFDGSNSKEGVRSPVSPPSIGRRMSSSLSSSPFGPLADTQNRRTFISLIQVLNACWVHYDFSTLTPEDFKKEDMSHVLNKINTFLSSTPSSNATSLLNKINHSLELEIQLNESVVYSFNPEPEHDPFETQNSLWHFHYFFFNKKLKRVVYFACKSTSKSTLSSVEETQDEVPDDYWYYDQAVYDEMHD